MLSTRVIALLALALTACGAPDVPAGTAESSARALNAILPKDLGGGTIADSASADGNVVVLKLVNVLELPGPQGNEMIARNLKTFACRNASYKAIVANGIPVRMEPIGKSGATMPAVVLDRCP